MIERAPQAIKNLLAISTGALAVTLVFFIFNWSAGWNNPSVLILAFIIALAHGVLLGLPIYFFIPVHVKKYWYLAIITGFFIGILPTLIFTYDGSNSGTYTSNGVEQIINGKRTTAGWISYLQFVLSAGALGIIGGISTWFAWSKMGYDFDKFKNIKVTKND